MQQGEQDAAADLVRRYEPMIRRVVRLRLAHTPLSAVLDSTDICQSVLASFFLRVNLGQYSPKSPEHLINLLATMARSKLINQVRREQAQRRDRRRNKPLDDGGIQLAARSSTPSRQYAARDLLQQVMHRLSPAERRLAQLRGKGFDWPSTAAAVGASPEAVRKQLTRAIDRVALELGLKDDL